LADRLYQVVFRGNYDSPEITIEIEDPNHPQIEILEFHLSVVILNEATLGWMEKTWANLARRPHEILRLVLPSTNVDGALLRDCLEQLRNSKDQEHETPNSWYSMFYTGLMNDPNRLSALATDINCLRV
jgi:hypothetical protein